MKVVVVGAGYAGTIAANRLARKVSDIDITVVNPRPDFIERVRLHEQLAGSGTAATPLPNMLRPEIKTRVGTVNRIHSGWVDLANATRLDYDYLILAVGSTVDALAGTIAVGTWEGAESARTSVAELSEGATVTVIGGGLTGIETAAELAESRPELSVRLVAASVGLSLSDRARARVRRTLERLGVDVVEDSVLEVATEPGTHRGIIHLQSGRELASDVTLWAVVGAVPDLAARSSLAVNDKGRALVDGYLRSVTDDRIFVVGDCAAVPGARLSCATAAPQGAHAADTLARMIKGRRVKPYSMGYVGQAVSLGRRDGIIQANRRDDTVRRFFLAGRTAALSKESVVRYAKFGTRTSVYAWMPGAK